MGLASQAYELTFMPCSVDIRFEKFICGKLAAYRTFVEDAAHCAIFKRFQ